MHSAPSNLPAEPALAERAVRCVVCGREMLAHLEPDLWLCPDCKYRCSTFDHRQSGAATLDETNRQRALEAIRRQSAQTILRVLSRYVSLPGALLCDIGCAYGWFLEEAERLGAQALGIEPDAPIAEQALARDLNVRTGPFPDCLEAAERFDLITLCDVLEHLPRIEQMVAACHAHLVSGGLLAVAVPTSGGTVFRAGCWLRRLGIRGPVNRLWQRGYPSPHRHYFNADNLRRLLGDHGFEPVHSQSLPAWQLRGLWNRLRMDAAAAPWKAAIAWSLLAPAYPLIRLMPSDILLQVYRRVECSPA